MASLSKLREKTFPVEIDFGDGDIVKMAMRPHVDGYREALEMRKKIEESEDDAETIKLVQEKFCRTVADWDLLDDAGATIPLTVEGVTAANVPVSLLGDLLVRGYDEVTNTKKRGKRTSSST